MPPCAGPGQRVGAGQPAPGFSARQPKRRWTSGASLRPPGFGTPRQTPRGTGMLRPPATACANAEKGGGRVHAKPDGSSSACTAAGRRRCKGCGAKAAALTSRSWLLGGASCSGVAFERTPAMRPTKMGSCPIIVHELSFGRHWSKARSFTCASAAPLPRCSPLPRRPRPSTSRNSLACGTVWQPVARPWPHSSAASIPSEGGRR